MNEDRIYVEPSGIRAKAGPSGILPCGCHWEEPDEDEDEDEGPHPAETGGIWAAYESAINHNQELADIKQKIALLLNERQGPSRARLAAQRVAPLLQRLVRGAPCVVVWAGMVATFFWNAAQSFDEQALAAVIDLPEEVPARMVAAAISTAVFCLWSYCVKSMIQNAVERKLDAGK